MLNVQIKLDISCIFYRNINYTQLINDIIHAYMVQWMTMILHKWTPACFMLTDLNTYTAYLCMYFRISKDTEQIRDNILNTCKCVSNEVPEILTLFILTQRNWNSRFGGLHMSVFHTLFRTIVQFCHFLIAKGDICNTEVAGNERKSNFLSNIALWILNIS